MGPGWGLAAGNSWEVDSRHGHGVFIRILQGMPGDIRRLVS